VLRATVISGSGISGSGGSFRVVLSPLQGGGDEGGDDEDNVAELETEIGEEVDEGPSPIVPEIRELVWTAGAFVVFALLMRYLLYPRVRRGMDARYNSIATGHSSAEATRAAARAEIADYERQLAAVRAEAAARVDAARQELESERVGQLAATNARLAQERAAAAEEDEAARVAVRDQVESAVADVVARAVELGTGTRPSPDVVRRAVAESMSAGVGR
jgi:F-type H+-transporting ATPase subunit b